METVNAFNSELCSLYSMKPPISKTKMVELTKMAMKAAKFYKHVVQSIEKFIHKCQPEFKIPGLYVIDSIVRQSRHQFGAEKDLFSQRFSKNIAVTFHNLLTCPSQDICKIVRVLNLWQKNSVFLPTIIQPLLDMAADPLNVNVYLTAQKSIQRATGVPPSAPQAASASAAAMSRTSVRPSVSSALLDLDLGVADPQNDLVKNISQLLQQVQQPIIPLINPQQLQLHLMQQQLLQHLQMQQQPEPQLQIDSNLMAQIQALTAALMSRLGSGGAGSVVRDELVSTMEPSPVINKKFVDVSYTESDLDDDRRDVNSCSSLSHVSAVPLEHGHSRKHKVSGSHPSALGHSSSKPLWSPEEGETSLTYDRDNDQSHDDISDIVTPRSSQPRLLTMGSEDVFVSPPASSLQQLQSTPCEDEVQEDRKASREFGRGGWKRDNDRDGWEREKDEWKKSGLRRLAGEDHQARTGSRDRQEGPGREDGQPEDFFRDRSSSLRLDHHVIKGHDLESETRAGKVTGKDLPSAKERYRGSSVVLEPDRKAARRRSRSRSPSRNSSRSRSQSRSIPVDKKKCSHSPDHKRWRPSEPEKDISRWERVREHPRLGLPPVKEQHACICSVTLWIGNVSKQLKEETLCAEVAKFGKASLELIPQRGCAFACFNTRQEAARALQGLNDLRLLDKNLKVTWAPNAGIKESEFKSRWDVDAGVTYIPWDRLPQSLDAIAVGAVVDVDSLPEHMKNLDEDGVPDDQMTSNEVTSSTDCQPDGQLPRSLPLSSNTPPNSNNPALPVNAPVPPPLQPPVSMVSDQAVEGTNSLAESLKSPLASFVPNVTDKEPALSMSSDDLRIPSEADATKEATSAAHSLLVQGIQNILNSTAAAASATQAIPGIITPGIMPPSTSTADSLFQPLPGMWPSLCGFNPLVPPPGFLATFDPTRPPPSLGPQSAAGDPSAPEERTAEETGGAENMSDNMDLDESVSSSQGDDQDFLESRVELIQSGSLHSAAQFAEAQQHSGSCWNPGAEYGKEEVKSDMESTMSGLEKRSVEDSGGCTTNATVEVNVRTGMSSAEGWRDGGHGISTGSVQPIISPVVTGLSFPISGVSPALLGQTGPMVVSAGFGPVQQGPLSGTMTFQPPLNQSSGFAGGLHTSEASQSGPNMGVLPPVISGGPGSQAFGPGSMPDHHQVRPGSAFGRPNALRGVSVDAASGSNGPGNPDVLPFAPIAVAGLSSSWPRGPVSGPNSLPDVTARLTAIAEGNDGPNAFHAMGPNMPSQGPRGLVPCGGPNNVELGRNPDAGSAVDQERQMHEMSRFPETSNQFHRLQDIDAREGPNRGSSLRGPFADLNQRPCGPNGMGGPFGPPSGRNQMSDGPTQMPFGPNRMPVVVSDGSSRMPFVPDGPFRMPGAPDGPNRFPFGPDGSNQVPNRHDGQNRMTVMSDGENQMHFAPNGMPSGPNRMPLGPGGPNPLLSRSDGMQGASGGQNRMPFGPNRMSNGSDGMQGGPFGIGMPFGTNRIPFGPNRMPVGLDGPNRMPFMPDGQNRISAGPDGMQNGPFGMSVGPHRMPDPNQMSGQTKMPGVNRGPGLNPMPGPTPVPGPNHMPMVPERSANEMLSENNGPRPSHPGMPSFNSGIPHGCQSGLAPGFGGPPGQPFPAVLTPGMGRGPGPSVPSGSGMMYSLPDGGPPTSCEQPTGYSGGMPSDQGSMHMGQTGMGPGSGRMPGPGGMVLGSSGMPQRPDRMPPGGPGLSPNGMPSGLSGLPPGSVGRFPGSDGMPRGPAGFPCGPNGMPVFQGGRFPGPGGNPAGQDGMPIGQGGRFPGPGGPPGGQDAMSIGQGGRFPGPNGPDGMACRMPLGSSRPSSSDGIPGNAGLDALGASLNQMPFGFPMGSGGMLGASGVRIGSGSSGMGCPGPSDMTQQQSGTREHRPGPDVDMVPERSSCPGSSSSDSRGSMPFQGPGFSNIRPGCFGEGQPQQFANSSSSAFDQHSVQVSSANLQGFLENEDKVKANIQRFLAPAIGGGGAAFPGLFGSGVVGPDGGKAGPDQLCQFGIDSKNAPVPSLFPNFDNIRLASGQLHFPGNDRFFFKPQLENLQMNDRLLRNDDEDDAPTTGRHIRRSDLFPSMKQRGRHQQGNHHRWSDRRRDRKNHSMKDFHDHEERESHDGYRRSSSKDGHDAAAPSRSDQAPKDSNSQKLSDTTSEANNSKTDKEVSANPPPPNQDTKEPASNSGRLDSLPNIRDEKTSS